MYRRRTLIPGTGLDAFTYVALVSVSVALFFLWGGLLWRVPRSTSHGMRFAVSYLAVIPLSALALAWRRRLSGATLLTSTATVWGAKLVITALVFVPLRLQAPSLAYADTTPPRATTPAPDEATDWTGMAVADALTLTIGPGGYDVTRAAVREGGVFRVRALDHRPHTVRPELDGEPATTLPLPQGTDVELVLEPGRYHLRCDHHPGEQAWVHVVAPTRGASPE